MNPIKKFTNSAQEIRLTDEERLTMRENLSSFMRANPAPAPLILSPYERFIGILSPLTGSALRTPVLALALLLLIGASGATAVAAEGAVPGDALYGIKVSLVEPVKGAFAVSDEAKAEWNTQLAETRLNEAEQLAVRSDLTPATQATLGQSFSTSVAAADTSIDNVAKKNPAAAANLKLALNLSLTAHGSVLATLVGDASSPNAPAVLALAEDVGSKVSRGNGEASALATASVPSNISPKHPTATTFAKVPQSSGFKAMSITATSSATTTDESTSTHTLVHAEDAVQAIREALTASSADLDASTTAHIQTTLDAADQNIAQGKQKLESKVYRDADSYFAKARVLTEESRLLLQLATSTFQFHVRTDVDATTTTSLAAPPATPAPPAIVTPPSKSGSSVSGSGGGSSGSGGGVGGVVHSVTGSLGL